MARVFISYSKKDLALLLPLAEALRAHGHEVWWDDRLRCDEQYREVIERNVGKAEAVITMWSPNSLLSDWVEDESRIAAEQRKLLNISYDGVSRRALPEFVREMHVESMSHWDGKDADDRAFLKLNDGIAKRKQQADERRLKAAIGPKIGHFVEESHILKVLFDLPLPGGLRIYRLLGGTLAATALIWLVLYATQMIAGDRVGLEWSDFFLTFFFILTVRLLHQMRRAVATGEIERYIDRFFESDFAYCTLISVLIGASVIFSYVLFHPDTALFDIVDGGLYCSGMALLLITLARFIWAIATTLHRRIR